ncbi:MAG: UPF0182 family protein [Thermodesulfobacteriota bacterium]|nr:UPF0182 family protein [Thermodesulfobacteriota bacterium]
MKKRLAFGFVLIAVLLLWAGISIYPDWLWFENLGFSPVFLTMLLSRFGLGSAIWLLLILIVGINLYVIKRFKKDDWRPIRSESGEDYVAQLGLTDRTLNTLLLAAIFIVSLYLAFKGSDRWDTLLRYLYQEPFGNMDPIFGKEIGFFVFSLPLYIYVQSGLLILVITGGLVSIGWYLKEGGIQIVGDIAQDQTAPPALPKVRIAPNVKRHLIFLAGVVVLLLAWGFHLKIYELLYSTQGPAFGANYTDLHAKVWAFRILMVLSIGFALVLFYDAFRPGKRRILWTGLAWVGFVLVLGTLIPMFVQKFVVKPNELAKELPYITYNIESTRKAYDLERIKALDFVADDELTAEDIRTHDVTIQNIRIWDERPLLQTYSQIQAIRLYYGFNNVDVDRYMINNQYRQVMLAGRELIADQLPPQANTWVNRHLTYTHGYGIACSPVNEVTAEGLPRLFVKDLPPSYKPELKIDRPEIYYGEKTAEYILVKTKTEEFDYPRGDKNVYTIYQGRGGVPIRSFARRLLFAIEFLDPQILFTTYLTQESKIMFRRPIKKRVRILAPFLSYDGDPYMVISEGKLFWIQDAYTTSNMYPYSTRSYGYFNKGLNYIRNSVKVTIDAYNGDVSFYSIDDEDPVLKTYAKAFPNMFKPLDEMPTDLKKHLRYPKDLFKIQAGAYSTYHMEDAQVFYNQEDLWQIPDELYGDSRQEMEPYYVIMKLPEEDKEEFLLMIPFSPSKKDNMIGWLAARSDLPNYGKLLVYKLPKEKLIYGPMQIEARVDQQTEISSELTLWGQRGSRVIRGNLLAIPIGDSFIYVEPVYLEAMQQEESQAPATPTNQPARSKQTQKGRSPMATAPLKSSTAALPELKRVIVAFGNRISMEENLERALQSVLGEDISFQHTGEEYGARDQSASSMGMRALEHYKRAKAYLRDGNWTGYGKELENLEKILLEMSAATGEKK